MVHWAGNTSGSSVMLIKPMRPQVETLRKYLERDQRSSVPSVLESWNKNWFGKKTRRYFFALVRCLALTKKDKKRLKRWQHPPRDPRPDCPGEDWIPHQFFPGQLLDLEQIPSPPQACLLTCTGRVLEAPLSFWTSIGFFFFNKKIGTWIFLASSKQTPSLN